MQSRPKKTLKETQNAKFHDQEIGLDIRKQISTKINFNVTSDSSVNKGKTIFAGSRGGEDISCMVQSKGFNVSLPQDDGQRPLDLSSRSKVNFGICDTVLIQSKNIKTTEIKSSHKRNREKICSQSGQNLLNDSPAKPNKRKQVKPRKSVATNMISINDSALLNTKLKFSGGVSDSGTSKVENVDDILAVAGPSGLQESQQQRNPCIQRPYLSYVSEIPCVRMRKQYPLICKVCNMEVEKHSLQEEKVYRCCKCGFNTLEQVNLQMHSYTHCPVKTCKISGKEYREGNLHDGEHQCNFCKKVFNCRSRYGEHLLLEDHDQYLRLNCWACSKDFFCHWIAKEKLFACCFCDYTSDGRYNVLMHNVNHHPKYYCRICKEEYLKMEGIFHGGKFSCSFCSNNYECQTQLEEHVRRDYETQFTKICRKCKGRISKHVQDQDGKALIECCVCRKTFSSENSLQNHLFKHISLRLFKCEACGQRYILQNQIIRHLTSCKAYKCEICGVTFPGKESLNMHRSEIHINE